MLMIGFLVCFQQLSLSPAATWEDLARPWMTRAEVELYESLDVSGRERFKGFFIARRTAQPEHWPKTGLYLAAFHCPKTFGDIRDQIRYALGEPSDITVMAGNPKLPAVWQYPEVTLTFQPEGSGQVRLANESNLAWERVKQARILRPDIRYDYRIHPFGRTRLPGDLTWLEGNVVSAWTVPEGKGATFHLVIPVPESLRDHVRENKANPVQNMELLIRLSGPDGTAVEDGRIRHASRQLNLLTSPYLVFEAYLPPGYFKAELLIYSGYLKMGVRTKHTLLVRPPEIPRIGEPLISQEWRQAGISIRGEGLVNAGETTYKPVLSYRASLPGRVLVHSEHEDTRVLLQSSAAQPQPLTQLSRSGNWWVFALPAREKPFRLLATGYPKSGDAVALSAWGPVYGDQDLTGFKQAEATNYLGLESLDIQAQSDLNLLFVNGVPLTGSRSGHFPWPSLDWGPTAAIRFEYGKQGRWYGAEYEMKRSGVFQQISVRPRYIVAGTRALDGSSAEVPVTVSLGSGTVTVQKRTPVATMPRLWGIVVDDSILKSPAWPSLRQAVSRWLKANTTPDDEIYLVHNAYRPELVLQPTVIKSVVQASLASLVPKTHDDSYFTVQYLIEAITHLKQHQTKPHQVLLLTRQLTDEIGQMEALIPRLRATGLHLYNLEFPLEAQAVEVVRRVEPDTLELQRLRAEEDERMHMGMRDNFMETRSTPTLLSWNIGGKKRRAASREDAIRDAAFHEAFNQQLARLSAGMAVSAGSGQSLSSLNLFFDELSHWQQNLAHMEIAAPFLEEDLVNLSVPEGFVVSWTLVEWRPPQ